MGKGRGEEVSVSFDRFCLAAGLETLGTMMQADARGSLWATAFARQHGAGAVIAGGAQRARSASTPARRTQMPVSLKDILEAYEFVCAGGGDEHQAFL